MIVFVPLLLLFGYLTSAVHKGDDFPFWLALALVTMSLPAFIAAARTRKRKLLPLGMMLVLGFCAWAFVGQAGVRFYLGPVLAGGSVLLAVVWSAIVIASTSIAVRTAARYRRGRLFIALMSATCVMLAGLVVSPALFTLGVTSYAGGGIYYGIPFVQQLFWLLSGLVAGAFGAWQYFDDEDALPPVVITSCMYILAFSTGVATGEQMWLAAILGMLLVQYCFHLKDSL